MPNGDTLNINIITATAGNGTGWNQTGTSLFPSAADSIIKIQTLGGGGNLCVQADNDGILSTVACSASPPSSSNFKLENVSNTTYISAISDNNLLQRVGNFDLRNISNYSQFIKSSDFNIGNISNATLTLGVLDNGSIIRAGNLTTLNTLDLYIRYKDFNIQNISNATGTGSNFNNNSDINVSKLNVVQINGTDLSLLPYWIHIGDFDLRNISNYSQFIKSVDFNLGNISNYTQFIKSIDFNLGNISNYTQYLTALTFVGNISNYLGGTDVNASFIKTGNLTTLNTLDLYIRYKDFNIANISNTTTSGSFSNFKLENVSNRTYIGAIIDFTDYNNSLRNSYSNFKLENVSNTTSWSNIINIPAFSNFQIGNISNSTIRNGSDANLTNLNVYSLNGTALSLFNKSIDLSGYLTGGSFSNFKLENVSNKTYIGAINDFTDYNNSLRNSYSNFKLENVSNVTPFTSITGMPAFSNFQLENVSNNTLTLGALDNNTILRTANISGLPFSRFTLENVSNRTYISAINDIGDFNNSLRSAYSNFQLANVSNTTSWSNIINIPAFSNFQLSNVSNNTINLDMFDNKTIIRIGNISWFNTSIVSSGFNFSIDLSSYLKSGSFSNFKLENVSNTTYISAISDNNLLARVGDFNIGNISNSTIRNGSDANLTNLNVYSLNGTALSLFNKSIDLSGYLTSGSFSNFKLENVSNVTGWVNIQNIPSTLPTVWSIGNISNYTQYLTALTFIGNISNYLGGTDVNSTFIKTSNLTTLDTLNLYIRYKDFNIGNISNTTTVGTGGTNPFNSTNNKVYFNDSTSSMNISQNLDVAGNLTIGSGKINLDIYSNGLYTFINSSQNLTIITPTNLIIIGNVNITGTLNVTGRIAFPNIASQSCLGTDAGGVLQAGTCGGSDTFNLGNISNYTQFIKSIDFNLGNISNTTYISAISDNNLLQRTANFNLGNISNDTLVKGNNASIALWNQSSPKDITTRFNVSITYHENQTIQFSNGTSANKVSFIQYWNGSCHISRNFISNQNVTLC